MNALRAFECAARLGNFSAAASELHVTHGAISRQVQTLEAWLGVKLFERAGRRVHLTDSGREYQGVLEHAFAEIARATTRVQNAGPSQQIIVNALPTFTMRWLLPRLTRFQQREPRAELRLVTSETPILGTEGFDVAIRRGPPAWPGCKFEQFLHEHELPVCSPGLLKRHRLKEPLDLARHTLLHADTRPRAWSTWLAKAGVPRLEPRARQHFNHFYLALQAAIDGLGVALGPVPIIDDELGSGRLVAPFASPVLDAQGYFWIVPARRAKDPTLLAFCEFLSQEGAASLPAPSSVSP